MSDKFKFSNIERSTLNKEMKDLFWFDPDKMLDRIESIIQDLGNSIQDGWIDVEDRLPEIDTYVLVYSPYKIHNATHEAISEYSRYGFTSMARVTHWQPLPSAPKQTKK